MIRGRVLQLFLCVVTLATASAAENYPDRTVTIIVPFAPGGGTDVVARVMAPVFGAKLGQSVVVENISGGAGNIASARVARSTPDGYTLIMHNVALALNVSLYPRSAFDPERDLEPIGFINTTPSVLLARKTLPVDTPRELAAWMKDHRARLAHPGVGSTGHIAVALLARAVGAEADFIPYRGGGPVLQDLVAGHVDLGTTTVGNAIEPVANGLVKAIGITGPGHVAAMPQVPSLVDELSPIMDVMFWNVLLAPAGTPKPVIDKINAALEATLADKELVETWAKAGIDLYPPEQRGPEAARTVLRGEIARWARAIRDNKVEMPPQ